MKRRSAPDPFETVLNLAADRLYATRVRLGGLLLADGAGTLYRISTAPEGFGPLSLGEPEAQRIRLQDLLTAARAFVVARRKARVDANEQADLPLALPKVKLD